MKRRAILLRGALPVFAAVAVFFNLNFDKFVFCGTDAEFFRRVYREYAVAAFDSFEKMFLPRVVFCCIDQIEARLIDCHGVEGG